MSYPDYTRFWHQSQNFTDVRDDHDLRHAKRQSWNSDTGLRSGEILMSNAGYSPRNQMHIPADRRYVPVFGPDVSDEFQRERNNSLAYDNMGYVNDRYVPEPRRSRSSFGSKDGRRMSHLRYNGPYENGSYDRRSVVSAQPLGRDIGYTIYKGRPASEPGGKSKKGGKKSDKHKQTTHTNGKIPERPLPDKPAWMKTFDAYARQDDELYKYDADSVKGQKKQREKVSKAATILKLFVICLIIWDLANDWLVAGAGPLDEILNGASESDIKDACIADSNKTALFKFSSNGTTSGIKCSDSNKFWMALVGFAILGSLITVIQVINIVLEIIKGCVGSVFQIFHGQSEVCLAMFLKDIPQAIILTPLFYSCDCSMVHDNIYLFSLMASISACLASTFRYVSSFNGIGGDDGCCNTWWRCCCCRDTEYCCRITAKDLFCKCELPVPFCCCTAGCENCKWAPKTWCAPLLKASSCYCTCCRTDDDLYGIRLVNLILLLALWVQVGFQVMFYVIQVS